MTTSRIAAGVVLMALMVASAPAVAQEEARRHGFWIGGAIGGGVNTASVSAAEYRGGFAGFIRAGGAPSGHVVIGTEFVGWVTERDSVTTTRTNVHLFVQYYPSETGSFFVKGGLGASEFGVSTPLGPGTLVTTSEGVGLTLGGGYEFPVSRVTALTANVDWVFQALDNKGVGPATSSLLLLTVGVTFPRIG